MNRFFASILILKKMVSYTSTDKQDYNEEPETKYIHVLWIAIDKILYIRSVYDTF